MREEPNPVGGLTRFPPLVMVPLVGAAILWASWPSLVEMVGRWSHDPRYSHGYLVPVFALFLLWHRRGMVDPAGWGPSWWGLALVGAGEAVRLAGVRYYLGWFEAASLLPSLAGLALLAGGRGALRWSWPAIVFLFFMIPLPYRVEYAMGYPLQRVATLASNYALQTLGLPAVAEGNVIHIDEARIGVVEACNGLGMLFMFLAFAGAAVLFLRRGVTDKVLIVLSAVPIAVAANVARITLTGLLHHTAGGRVADVVYHDLAGWLMMPLAVTSLWAECWLLSHLFIEVERAGAVPAGFAPPAGDPGYEPRLRGPSAR